MMGKITSYRCRNCSALFSPSIFSKYAGGNVICQECGCVNGDADIISYEEQITHLFDGKEG